MEIRKMDLQNYRETVKNLAKQSEVELGPLAIDLSKVYAEDLLRHRQADGTKEVRG